MTPGLHGFKHTSRLQRRCWTPYYHTDLLTVQWFKASHHEQLAISALQIGTFPQKALPWCSASSPYLLCSYDQQPVAPGLPCQDSVCKYGIPSSGPIPSDKWKSSFFDHIWRFLQQPVNGKSALHNDTLPTSMKTRKQSHISLVLAS